MKDPGLSSRWLVLGTFFVSSGRLGGELPSPFMSSRVECGIVVSFYGVSISLKRGL